MTVAVFGDCFMSGFFTRAWGSEAASTGWRVVGGGWLIPGLLCGSQPEHSSVGWAWSSWVCGQFRAFPDTFQLYFRCLFFYQKLEDFSCGDE